MSVSEIELNQTEEEALTPTPVYRRGRLVALCYGTMTLYALYLGALGVLLPFIGSSFRLGSAVAGRLFPADFLGFVVGVLLCGYLSDRFGRKLVLMLGIAGYGSGLALFGISPSFGIALLATALIGAGSGAMETVASALASDLFPERRASILNAMQTVFGAGAATAPILAHLLVARGTDWRTLYVGLAAATGLLFLAQALQPMPRTRHGGEAIQADALLRLLAEPGFLALCLAQALYVGAEAGFTGWMPTYFTRRLPGGSAWAGFVITIFWIAMTSGRLVTGTLVSRTPLLRLALILSVGGTLSSALALLWMPPLIAQCFVACTGLCFSGIFGLILAEAGERYPTRAGTAFGGIVAAGGIGGAVAPWVIGALAETSLNWRGALLLVPVIMASLSGLMLSLQRIPKRA